MPQVDQVPRRSKKPFVIAAVGGVVAVGLIVGGVFLAQWLMRDTTAATKMAEKTALAKSFQGDYDAATEILKKQLAVAKTEEERLDIYLALGQNYMIAKDYKSAIGVYKKGAVLRPGFGTNETIAKAAELDGNKSLALEYYAKNRALIKAGKAGNRGGELPRIEEAIVSLGGKL